MTKYDTDKIKQILEDNENFPFKVLKIIKGNNHFLIHVREYGCSFAEYCRNNLPKRFSFKNNDEMYEAEKFYINLNGQVKIVFVLKKDDVILNICSLYECEHPELFANDYLNLSIDEVIKEDY